MPPSTPTPRSVSGNRYSPYQSSASDANINQTTSHSPTSPSSSTTTFVLPKTFRIVGTESSSLRCITEPGENRALQRAYQLARRLVWGSDRSMAVTNSALAVGELPRRVNDPAPSAHDWRTTEVEEEILEFQRQFENNNDVEVVVDKLTSAYGYVSESEPNVIRIRRDLVVSAGLAYCNKKEQPHILKAHLLFLGVTIAHEIQHVLRMLSIESQFHTPPSVWDNRHTRRGTLNDKNGTKVLRGESGFYWEREFLGGKLDAYLCDQDENALFANQIEFLAISFVKDNKLFSTAVAPSIITQIVDGLPGWQSRLPITGRDPNLREGHFRNKRLRGTLECCHRETEEPEQHTNILPYVQITPSPSPKRTTYDTRTLSLTERINVLKQFKKQESDKNVVNAGPIYIPDPDDNCGTKAGETILYAKDFGYSSWEGLYPSRESKN